METTQQKTFEGSLRDLEDVVVKLDNPKLSPEESLVLFEKGVELIRDCQHLLEEAESHTRSPKKTDLRPTLVNNSSEGRNV